MDGRNELAAGSGGNVDAALRETENAVEDERFVIKLAKPYEFEHKVYTEIDLTGMEELTGTDMIAINKIMQRTAGDVGFAPEVSMEYACHFAARAAKLPVEFFFQLPPYALMKVKSRVMGFLFASG